VKGTVLVLIAVAVAAFAAGFFLTPHLVNHSRWHPQVVATSRDAAENDVDAYGNEVTRAVAEYSLDPDGDLYELHSPQTEIPHLSAPKT